jgi:hypothetical protein
MFSHFILGRNEICWIIFELRTAVLQQDLLTFTLAYLSPEKLLGFTFSCFPICNSFRYLFSIIYLILLFSFFLIRVPQFYTRDLLMNPRNTYPLALSLSLSIYNLTQSVNLGWDSPNSTKYHRKIEEASRAVSWF